MIDYVTVSNESCLTAAKEYKIFKKGPPTKDATKMTKEEVEDELDVLEGAIGGIVNRHPVPIYLVFAIFIPAIGILIPILFHVAYAGRKKALEKRLDRIAERNKKKMKAMVLAGEEKRYGFKALKNIILKQLKKPKVWKSLTAGLISMVVIGALIKVYKMMKNKKAVTELERVNKKLERANNK